MGSDQHIAAFPFRHSERSYLQHEPQLVSALHVLLVVHPVEFDDIGVVGEGFEDVVLCFDLLINILRNKESRSAQVLISVHFLDK